MLDDGAGAGAPFTGSLPHASARTQQRGAATLTRFMLRKLARARRGRYASNALNFTAEVRAGPHQLACLLPPALAKLRK